MSRQRWRREKVDRKLVIEKSFLSNTAATMRFHKDKSTSSSFNARRLFGECLAITGLTVLGITLANLFYLNSHEKNHRNAATIPGDLRRLDNGDDSPLIYSALESIETVNKRNVSSLIVNIGSFKDPIMPRKEDGPCAMSLAFEPIAHAKIPSHPQLEVVRAAARGGHGVGMATMTVYDSGKSSSLGKPSFVANWNRRIGDGVEKKVALLSTRTILEKIQHPIDLLMTDMEGFDFEAILSVGHLIVEKGVKRLVTEVMFDDQITFEGQTNDFCRDWVPFMERLGYVYEGSVPFRKFRVNDGKDSFTERCQALNKANGPDRQHKPGNMKVFDAYWRLASVDPHLNISSREAYLAYKYPYHVLHHGINPDYHRFTDEEYAQCLDSLVKDRLPMEDARL